jgi:hypothetical protein
MAEKVYGIAESKSKVEVQRKADVYTKSETYNKNECYSKSETYSQSQTDINFLRKSEGAPKNHASTADTYGLGTLTNYGHCKLTTSLDAPSGNQDGIALAGSAGYTLVQMINSVAAAAQIPVGGVYWSFHADNNVAQTLGYGVWEYCCIINYSAKPSEQTESAVYAYRRVS